MPTSLQNKIFGLKKEGTRGTAETTVTRYLPVGASSEFNYVRELVNSDHVVGSKVRLAPVAGVKTGTGQLVDIWAEPNNIGELILSLLGSVSSAQQGGSAAYLHSFSQLTTHQHPGYTMYLGRDSSYKYNMSTVKKLSLVGDVDQPISLAADILFITEAAGPSLTPTLASPAPLIFKDTAFKIAGSTNQNVRSWSMDIDNGAFAKRALAQSYDIADILVAAKIMISGKFILWHESATERDKFIAGTSSDIQMLAEGATIASTYKYTLDVDTPEVFYKAFPFIDQDGILASEVEYEAFYDVADTKQVSIALMNTVTAY